MVSIVFNPFTAKYTVNGQTMTIPQYRKWAETQKAIGVDPVFAAIGVSAPMLIIGIIALIVIAILIWYFFFRK